MNNQTHSQKIVEKTTPNVLTTSGYGSQIYCVVCENHNRDRLNLCKQCGNVVCYRHRERHICTPSGRSLGTSPISSETPTNLIVPKHISDAFEFLAINQSEITRRLTNLIEEVKQLKEEVKNATINTTKL